MAAADPRVDDEAFVTLATNDTYALGALVLGNSLRSVGTSRQLAIMITPGVTATMRQQLSEVFDCIRVVDVLDSRDTMNLDLLTRPDLGVTFTKLHCWRLTQYSKAVFMDADTLAIQNIDELFDREELSAAPDAGWPDCFNSGVFVFRPSEATYEALLQFAVSHGSFDGGDQGLLNLFFSDWATKDIARHLPFLYNVVSQAFYSYLPAFKQFGKDVKVVHFIGAVKPWHQSYNTATGTVSTQQGVGHNTDFLQLWWKTFMDKVQPHLNSDVEDPTQSQHLNIYEEYPLPPHPYSNYQEDMSSHEMTAPYVPPQVDTYYHEESPSDNAHAPTGQYRVENKDDRDFSHYEAFYSEPPMSQSDNYPTPQEEMYQAKEFEQSLYGFSQEPETDAALDHTHESTSTSHELTSPETPSYPVSSDNSPTHSTNTAQQVETSPVVKYSPESSPPPPPPPSPPPESGLATADDDEQSVISTDTLLSTLATETDTAEEVTDNTASEPEVDISEGVASLQLSGRSYTDDELENRHRQYDWEKGQIDYLGIDSFSNILTKLQSTISKHTEGQADSE